MEQVFGFYEACEGSQLNEGEPGVGKLKGAGKLNLAGAMGRENDRARVLGMNLKGIPEPEGMGFAWGRSNSFPACRTSKSGCFSGTVS